MATKALQRVETNRDESYHRYKWEALANGDDGAPLHLGGYADRSLQVEGTFGSGGTLVFEGSLNDGSNYRTGKDLDGVALEITAAGIYEIRTLMSLGRPRVTAGDGTTDLDVFIMVRN